MNKAICNVKDIADIFSVFHDGWVEDIYYSDRNLKLKIGIPYLAKAIAQGASGFEVSLESIKDFRFCSLTNEAERTPVIIENTKDILNLQLEILRGDVVDGSVRVLCQTHVSERLSTGGHLFIEAKSATVEAENGAQVSIEELRDTSSAYWNAWEAKNKHSQ
ncbi:hypothetical protein BKI51_07710 [Alphaproteobacteria bacterium AO1-B]|nr:hypothetical protein BKI51_07710 [Alphaproteobacteria bacterium AO1-B]